MVKLLRWLLAIIGSVFLVNAIWLWTVSNCNVGLILLTAFGACFLLYARFMRLINRLLQNKFGLIVKTVVFLVAVYFLFTGSMLIMSATNDTATFKEDAVIVLGAAVRGEQVTLPLAYRLDAAVTYHKINPFIFYLVLIYIFRLDLST